MSAALGGLKNRGYIPKVVYDIGAAVGGWTRNAIQYWPDSVFICFEPLNERAPNLTALRNAFPNNVGVFNCGVGDSDGDFVLGISETLWGSSFSYIPNGKSRLAPVKKLDTIIESGTPPPSFIKIDVQGFEKKVLDGGSKTISNADLILMECNFFKFCKDMVTLDETILYMSRRGFIPYEFVDFLRRPLDGAMGQCDILFVRKDHWLVTNQTWG